MTESECLPAPSVDLIEVLAATLRATVLRADWYYQLRPGDLVYEISSMSATGIERIGVLREIRPRTDGDKEVEILTLDGRVKTWVNCAFARIPCNREDARAIVKETLSGYGTSSRPLTDALAADVFTDHVSKAEVDQDLRDAGGDPEAIGERGVMLVQELLEKRREV